MKNKHSHIDDLIKEGFSNDSSKFDADSWSALANKLDSGKTSIDHVIASSFVHDNVELPDSVWSNLNNELDIDTVWHRINGLLQKRKRVFAWWWSAAAMLMLLSIIYADKGAIYDKALSAEKELSQAFPVFKSSNSIDVLSLETKKSEEHNNDEIADLNNSSNLNPTIDFDGGFYNDHQSLISQNQQVSSNPSYNMDKKGITNADVSSLGIPTIHKIEKMPLIATPSLIPIERKKEKTTKYELGIGLGLQNLIVVDGQTKAALSPNSNSKLKHSIRPCVSLNARIYLSDQLFLTSNLAPKYTSRSSLLIYEKLTQVEKLTELELSSFSLGFGAKVPLVQSNENLNLLFAGQLFGTYMWSGITYKNGTIVDNTLDLRKVDFGLRASVSLKKNINSFYIEPKLATNFGFRNHLKSNEFASDFLTKRLISSELSFVIGYRF